jgi:hypothetical protein
MKVINKMIFVSLIFILISCDGQNKNNNSTDHKAKNKMTEQFDFKAYEKRTSAVHRITKNDTIIEMTFIENKIGTYTEIPPKPSFLTIYKEFYSNGSIKKKETYIGERTKVGISEYYDNDGNVEKVDEDKKFGKVKYPQVLQFLEQKGIINTKTGDGKFDKDERPKFELAFDDKNGRKEWIISIKNGKKNDNPDFSGGEPVAFVDLEYKMDGETGKVEEIK